MAMHRLGGLRVQARLPACEHCRAHRSACLLVPQRMRRCHPRLHTLAATPCISKTASTLTTAAKRLALATIATAVALALASSTIPTITIAVTRGVIPAVSRVPFAVSAAAMPLTAPAFPLAPAAVTSAAVASFSEARLPASRCTDDPTYIDNGWRCTDWVGFACRPGFRPVNTAERIARLVYSVPFAVSAAAMPLTAPAFPLAPATVTSAAVASFSEARLPASRCTDDPTYIDNGWRCTDWVGFACRPGFRPVNTAERIARLVYSPGFRPVNTVERIALLVYSCPNACTDVTPVCIPSPPALASPS
ncbi:hypothetical protein AB1Y20_009336 [Prymnesium parvum]|uniref:Uncharacterized protein n=1 Tax=Prymnesium parvum TaxID=97485 RepID=A0AB34K5E0_PRYPA